MPGPTRGLPRFRVLGPLEVWLVPEERLPLSGVVQERVLTALLLESGRVVPVSRIVDAVWDEQPPASASHQVRKAVSDLRRRIPDGWSVIETAGTGYRMRIEEDELDLSRFTRAADRAKEAVAGARVADAAAELRAALDLWRGPAAGGDGGAVVAAMAAALDERRASVAEQLVELRLSLGESSEVLGDLRELIAAHPLRETLRRQLMLALYRSGRQADALNEYHEVRRLLAEELGIDPGPDLVRLHEQILNASGDLAAPAQPEPIEVAPASTASSAPNTLPYDVEDFVGRESVLRGLLDGSGPQTTAIDGIGGSGKTALAVHAAHRLAEQYPDGRLYVDLQGHTSGERPSQPGTVLLTLLRLAGEPERSDTDLAALSHAWRAVLARRRLLVVLDNAEDFAQIRPLLPSAPGSRVIVTSRARLLDLDAARWVTLGELPAEESRALLCATLGADRVAAEPAAASQLAELCGQLPLALRIAAARLRNRPEWTIEHMVERLSDETRRLDELTTVHRSVAATIRSSYEALTGAARTALRLLAIHPGPRVDVHVGAALFGCSLRAAERILESLSDARLLQIPEIGAYRLHNLVRSFAITLRSDATAAEDTRALERLLTYYAAASDAACRSLFPGWQRRENLLPHGETELPALDSADGALSWFDREQSALLAAVGRGAKHQLDLHVAHIGRNMLFHLNLRGLYTEYYEVATVGVAAARRLGDPALLQFSLSNLATACWKLGRLNEGVAVARQALAAALTAGDQEAEARCRATLGLLTTTMGRFTEALGHLERAITLAERQGRLYRAADSLTVLSMLHESRGSYPEAIAAARRAVGHSRELGSAENEVVALTDEALAHLGSGALTAAAECLAEARRLCDESRMPGNVALVLAYSAEVSQLSGEEAAAAEFAERALRLSATCGSPIRQAAIANAIGRVHRAREEFDRAGDLHRSAYRCASEVGFRIEVARALSGIAACADATGDGLAGREHHRRAAELFEELGVPEPARR